MNGTIGMAVFFVLVVISALIVIPVARRSKK